ncbi:MAG: hypothetical protein IPF60_12480 [Betaproteobacteria bacterium]|nr:hypothetical protein [Betaproteobacteria bacterium]
MIEVLAGAHPADDPQRTKGALIERDLDLLAPLAAPQACPRLLLASARLDRELARRLDPRPAPQRRLGTGRGLAAAGFRSA